MRQAFAHDAVVVLDAGGDERAPGGAITVELCGHWDHEPPCPLAAHHTGVRRTGDEVQLRVLFATEPADEDEVRRRIGDALALGASTGPDGRRTTWRLLASAPGTVTAEERPHAERLIIS
jgi:hypothetical protein